MKAKAKKISKKIFNFKEEGIDEKDIDNILLKQRCDTCIVKLPPLKGPLKKTREKVINDILNACVTAQNDYYAGDAIGGSISIDGKPRPDFVLEPPNQDIAAAIKEKKKEIINKGGVSNVKSRQYAYSIGRLSAMINDPYITSEFRNQCEEQKKHLQSLKNNEEQTYNLKERWENALKINQIIDQQVYDLCKVVMKKRRDIDAEKCFCLVAEILTAKGRRGITAKTVHTAYWNVFNRTETKSGKTTRRRRNN